MLFRALVNYSWQNLAVATLVEGGQVKVLGDKDHIFKRSLEPEDEASGACDLTQQPYGGSGDSKEGDRSRKEQGQPSRALFRCVLGSEKKRVPPQSLLWRPLVI